MKLKKKIRSTVLVVGLLTLAGCNKSSAVIPTPANTPSPAELTTNLDNDVIETKNPDNSIGDNLPVSRALAAKMISIAYSDPNSIRNLEREITFIDTDRDKWYDEYVNAVYVQDIMKGDGQNFKPNEPLSIEQAQFLIEKLNPKTKIKIQINDSNKNNPISYALWADLYLRLLTELSEGKSIKDVFGIDEESIIVLATPANHSRLSGFNMITDRGAYTFSGLVMDSYIDKEIKTLVKDKEIISVISIERHSPIIKNCYVVKSGDGSITIFTGGAERTFSYNTTENLSGKICDIEIEGNEAREVVVYENKFTDIIKSTSASELELKNNGVMSFSKDLKVYSVVDGLVKWSYLSNLIVGTDNAEFVIGKDEVCAAIIKKTSEASTIRVAISDTGFKSLIHDSVSLTGTTDFTVDLGGETKKYKAGEILNISQTENKDLFGKKRIYITPSSDNGKIQITSIKRSWSDNESPKYRGIIEIAKNGDNFTIVNEIGMEQYLYAVVPSEMPSGHGIEASKVQAVTARSYAYNQYFTNRYHQYGANVDDSVLSQVYNNIPENDTSIRAVDSTKGQCLTYNGEVVSANFFSTSSGMTANSGEVWSNFATKEFPAETTPYLQATQQYEGRNFGDLSKEEVAAEFFKNKSINSYDKNFSWFRWEVEMSAEEIAASINANLKERYTANPALIKTLQANNVYRSRDISTIGGLKDLQILKRGAGGNIMEMRIIGTDASINVSTEYNIRTLIRPYKYLGDRDNVSISRSDNTQISNYSIMPSAFYTMDKTLDTEGNLQKVKFYGGGNGHGVGMSQNGVKGMIDAGFSPEEILSHYYKGTKLEQMY